MRVKVSEGKTKDAAIIDVTLENYIVPDNEKHLYHCVIEIKKFDSETGKRLSIPVFRSSAKRGYENSIADNLKKQGYTITVLHDPNEYMKAKAEADEKAKVQRKPKPPRKKPGRCQSKSRGGRQSPCRGKGSIESRDFGRIESGGVIPATTAKEPKADAKAKAEADAKAEGKK